MSAFRAPIRVAFPCTVLGALLLSAPPLPAQQPVTSVTLQQAIRMAEAANPNVVSATGSLRSADLNVRQAKWAFVPALTFQPQAALALSSGQSRLDPVTGEVISGNQTNPSYQIGLNGNILLFDGFRRNYDLKSARANDDAADAALTAARFNSSLNTTAIFLAALSDQQVVKVRELSVGLADQQFKVAVGKMRSGSAGIVDSLSAQVGLNSARLQLLIAQSQLATDEAQLARAIGVPGRVAAIDDPAFYKAPTPPDTAALLREALESSPAVKTYAANLARARAMYRSSKTGYLPQLSLSAGENWTADKNSDYSLIARRSLLLNLSISPWTSLQRETQVENARIQIDNAEATLRDQQRSVEAQLAQQFAQLTNAQAQLDLSATSATASQLEVDVRTARYSAGSGTIIELLTAQQQLIQNQVDAITLRFTYLRAKAQIEAILGRAL